MHKVIISTVSAAALAAVGFMSATPGEAASASCGMNNGQKATGAPIELGALVSKTGPDDFSSSAQSAAAYFDCVNANGGIHGRPIHYTTADDQWNPELSNQLATKLIVDQHVLAMVGNATYVGCAANDRLYAKNDVVDVAGTGVTRECFTSRNIAALNEGPRLSQIAAAEYAHDSLGAKSMVCVSVNIPGMGDWTCNGMTEWGKANNVAVRTILIDPASLDAMTTMLNVASSSPDAVVLGVPKAIIVALLSAAEQQDLASRMKFVAAATAYSVEVPKALGAYWNNQLWVAMELQPIDGAGADTQNWHAVMDKYARKESPRDSFSQGGYLAARLATEALLKLDPNKIDRKTITAALRQVKGLKTDLLCSPWYFGRNANHATSIAVDADGAWKTVRGCKEIADPELKDVHEFETSLTK